jgi:hypothetical protein
MPAPYEEVLAERGSTNVCLFVGSHVCEGRA